VARAPMKVEMDPLSDIDGTEQFEALLIREELRRARTGETLAVAVLDLDGMRDTNARHGAGAGTEMLRLCADSIQRSLRSVDALARTGSDEFSVLLHATDARSAAAWARRFEDTLEKSGGSHPAAPVTCSLGIADTSEAPTLMQAARRARGRMEAVQAVRKLRRARESGS
jgi:diguanylate cyclase (GGDEF)-like protein